MNNLNKYNCEGVILDSNSYGKFKIIKYISTNEVFIEFIRTGFKTTAAFNNIKKGAVKDPYFPNIYGVGFVGAGKYQTRINSIQSTSYKRWKEMLNRCYNPKCESYKNYGERGVYVCTEWHNYQNYAEWYETNCPDEKFVVDKDILNKGNNCYCPEYCCFVPVEINTALTSRRRCRGNFPIGVREKDGKIIAQITYLGEKLHLGTFDSIESAFNAYKLKKEECLRAYAEMYKDKISTSVYNALYNYKVEITD